MNPDSELQKQDERIRRVVQGLSIPEAPRTIAEDVRRRVHLRRLWWRNAIGMSAVAVLLLGVLIWRPWDSAATKPHDGATVHARDAVAPELDGGTVNRLFALPPVDLLAVLDRRLEVAIQVLNSKEIN